MGNCLSLGNSRNLLEVQGNARRRTNQPAVQQTYLHIPELRQLHTLRKEDARTRSTVTDYSGITASEETDFGTEQSSLRPNSIVTDLSTENEASSDYSTLHSTRNFPRQMEQQMAEGQDEMYIQDIQKKITWNFRRLQQHLATEEMTDVMIQKDIFDLDDGMGITAIPTQTRKADLFLQKVIHKLPGAYEPFLSGLDECGCSFLLVDGDLPRNNTVIEFEKSFSPYSSNIIKHNLVQNMNEIISLIDQPERFSAYFVEYQIFDIDSHEEIFVQPTRKSKAQTMMNSVIDSLPRSFDVLLLACEDQERHHLLNKLKTCVEPRVEAGYSNFAAQDPNVGFQGSKLKMTMDSGHLDKPGSPLPDNNRTFNHCINITIQTNNSERLCKLENSLVEIFNSNRGDMQLRHEAIRTTSCKYTQTEHGSIIITVRPTRGRCYQHLLHLCKPQTIIRFLKNALCQDPVLDLIREDGDLKCRVIVELGAEIKTETKDEKGFAVSWKERLARRIPYLVEVLDMFRYLEEMQNEGIFNEIDTTSLKRFANVSRPGRCRRVLECLMGKEDVHFVHFIEFLRKLHYNDIADQLTIDENKDAIDLQYGIVDNYAFLLDEISPDAMKEMLIVNEVFDEEFFSQISSLSRYDKAVVLVQSLLDKSNRAMNVFVDALRMTECHVAAQRILDSASTHCIHENFEQDEDGNVRVDILEKSDIAAPRFVGQFTIQMENDVTEDGADDTTLSQISTDISGQDISDFPFAGQFTCRLRKSERRRFTIAPLRNFTDALIQLTVKSADENNSRPCDIILETPSVFLTAEKTLDISSSRNSLNVRSDLFSAVPSDGVSEAIIDINFTNVKILESESDQVIQYPHTHYGYTLYRTFSQRSVAKPFKDLDQDSSYGSGGDAECFV